MVKNPSEEALDLAENVLSIIHKNESLSVTNLLRQCARIAELLELDDVLWINNELNGYPDDDVPSYRLVEVECHYIWFGQLPHAVASIRGIKEAFYKRWTETITLRVSSVKLEFWSQEKTHTIELRKTIKNGINVSEVAWLQAEQTWEILHRIVSKIHEFVSRISIDLKFGGRIESIFSESRKFVDRMLSEICPSVLRDLETTYEKAIQSDSPLEWSQVAFACRQILQGFANSIFVEDYLPEGEKKPTMNQTIKKIGFTLKAKLGSTNESNRKLIESQVNYLVDYFSKINEVVQKNIHPVNFSVQKEDAHKCIIYTYLVIGDILRLL